MNGSAGHSFEMHSDGDHFGTAVAWQDDDGHWITLSWSELVPVDDVVALAQRAEPIDAEAWDLLRRTLGSEAVIAGQGNDHVEHVVARGDGSGGIPFQLVALIPTDYPLNDNDQRLSCYRLDLENQTGEVHCDTHPWWTRAGDATFVFGTSAPSVTDISVTRIGVDERPHEDTPISAKTVMAPVPAPTRFYVVEVPDWCWVVIAAGDGTPDDRLGAVGPLPSNEHHSRCLDE